MRWLAVVAAVALAAFGGTALRRFPRWIPLFALLASFLPFVNLDSTDIDLVADPFYRGESNGVTVTLVDVLAVALFTALPFEGRIGPYWKTRLVYLAIAVLSVINTEVPIYTWFAVWKLVRAYFYLSVVGRICAQPALAPWLVTGLGVGVVYSAVIAAYQRYVLHWYQSMAHFPHQNTLGMAANLVFPIGLALLLHGKKWKLPLVVVAAAGFCVVLTLSRGALMMLAIACTMVFVGSFLRRPTLHKGRVAGAFSLGAALVVAKSWDTLVARFEHAPRQSEMAREKFNEAASMMLSDHPLGVGLNQYSYVLSHDAYAVAVKLPAVDRDGLAHHIYWLTAAELGWAGLAAYVALLAVPLALAVHGAAIARRDDVRGDVLLGCAVALLVMYIHGTAEWVARQMPTTYLFWAIAAIVWGLARAVRADRDREQELAPAAP